MSWLTDDVGAFRLKEDGGYYRDAVVERRFWLWGSSARQSFRRWKAQGLLVRFPQSS